MVYALVLRYNIYMLSLSKRKITWSANMAYAVGLITTDGNLSKDGRHIFLVSKDLDQIQNFRKCLKIKPKIGEKTGGFPGSTKCYYVQFSDVVLYRFLVELGLTSAKSKTLGVLSIPNKYFFDFLRGSFDGDGSSYSYWDKRWRSSYLFYLSFTSASQSHCTWLQNTIELLTQARGHISKQSNVGIYQLRFAKTEARKIINKMYYKPTVVCLERKRRKVYTSLAIDDRNNYARVVELADTQP